MRNIILTSIILLLVGCSKSDEINISAASSLTDVMAEICSDYSNINLNFGGSGTLRNQIENGADIDIFISAEVNKIYENTEELVKNELVLISNNAENTFEDFLNNSNSVIGIGNPEFVPAGVFTTRILEKYEIKNTLNLASDVKQVLTWVQSGNLDYGFVYLTDAIGHKNVYIVKIFDEIDDIIYTITALNDKKSTNEFVDEIKNKIELFIEFGFKVV